MAVSQSVSQSVNQSVSLTEPRDQFSHFFFYKFNAFWLFKKIYEDMVLQGFFVLCFLFFLLTQRKKKDGGKKIQSMLFGASKLNSNISNILE